MTVPCRIEIARRRISSQWVVICLVFSAGPDQTLQRRIAGRFLDDGEPLVGQVADPRRESVAQEMAEGEDMIGEPAGVRVMLLDAKVGLVVEQAVEHVGGVADRGVDDLGMERGILVGDVRVEGRARVVPVPGVHLAPGLADAAGPEPLAVRGRRRALAPVVGERLLAVVVDDLGQPLAIGLVADVPVGDPAQPRQGRAGAGIRHPVQPEVDRIGQDGGQQERAIGRDVAVAKVHEMLGERRPDVDLDQEVGDLDARQHRGDLPRQGIGFRRHRVGQRRDLQHAVGQRSVGQLAALGQGVDRGERLVEFGPAPIQVIPAAGVDRQGQAVRLHRREGLRR